MAPQITKFTKENLYALADDASLSQRKRVNRNFHKDSFDPINRLCISMIKGTYVRPHRHPDKWELMLTISGEIGVLIFNDAGEVIDTFKLFSKGMLIFEMEPGTWHTLYSISEHAA